MTQESFPIEIRASVQGFINGFSRLCCGLFGARFSPGPGAASTDSATMWCFAAIVVVEGIAGTVMIRAQKKYGTDEERQFAKANA